MFYRRKRTAWLCTMLMAAGAAMASTHPSPPVLVTECLRELMASGVDVLYSSELVPPSLQAPAPLTGSDPMSRAVEALAAHGLILRRTGPQSYLVTRAPAALAPPSTLAERSKPDRPDEALEEVSVFGSRYEFAMNTPGEPVGFDARAIEQVPGADADTLRALHTAPGLATNLSARPYIRGALLDDVLVEYDGIPLSDPFHFKTFQSILSVFDPSTVTRADVFTGGFPVQFGTRSGGVLDLTPRSIDSGSEYSVGASLFNYDLGSVGKSAVWPIEWLFNARTSIDHSEVQPLAGVYGEPKFADGVGRIRWSPSSNAALTFGLIMLDDRIRLTSNSAQEQASDVSRDLDTWLKWDWSPTDALRSRSSITLANTERNSNGSVDIPGVATGTLYAERSFSNRTFRSDWSYAPSPSLTWNFGGEFGRESAELAFVRHELFSPPIALGFDRTADASIISNQAPRSSTSGLYASGLVHWRDLEAEVGLRFDGQTYQGFGSRGQLSPRFNLRYDLAENWHAYGSLGQFTQAQRVDEYRAEQNQTTPDPASRAMHLLTGIAHESEAAIDWRLEAYRNHWSTISPYYDNLLGSVSLTPELAPDRILVSPADAESAGVELSARRAFGRGFSASGIYSISTVTDDINGQDISRSWDQRHAANLGLAWTDRRTTASALFGWHSGWPTTPLTLVPATSAAPAYFIAGARNSAHWGAFMSADLHVSTTVPMHYGELSLWIDATNITGRANECCAELSSVNAAASPPTVLDKFWAPRVVNVGFSWRIKRPTGR